MIKLDVAFALSMARNWASLDANGGYSYVALFYRNNHLYQIEGTVFLAGGQAEVDAARFQQSPRSHLTEPETRR